MVQGAARRRWSAALGAGQRRVLPYEPPPSEHLFAAHTTGLAVAATREEAAFIGLRECFERDRYSRAIARLAAGHADAGGTIRKEVLSEAPRGLWSLLESAGPRVVTRDVSADLGVPTAVATLCMSDSAHLGCAARLSLDAAVEAAILEAVQSRVTDCPGAREDLPPRDPAQRPHPWFTTEDAVDDRYPANRESRDTPGGDGDPALAWATLRRLLLAAGIPDAVVVDISLPSVPLCAVRVVAPGLEDWSADGDRAGPRLRAWLA